MIDKIGFGSEIDMIESVASGLGRGLEKSDREGQSCDFRDVLASEMNGAGQPAEAAANQQPPQPSSGQVSDTPEKKASTPRESDDAINANETEGAEHAAENPVSPDDERPVEKPRNPFDSNGNEGNLTAKITCKQIRPNNNGNGATAVNHGEKEAYVTPTKIDSSAKEDPSGELDNGKSDECVLDLLGISPTALGVTAQIVVDVDDQGSELAENVVLLESGAKQKAGNLRELQQRLARGVSQTVAFAGKAEQPGNINPTEEATSIAAAGLGQSSLIETTKELSRRFRANPHEGSQWKKENVASEKENSGSSLTLPKRPGGNLSLGDPSLLGSAIAIASNQATPNEAEKSSLESVESLKQDLGISIQRGDHSQIEGSRRDITFNHNVSKFVEQAEHVVTIQRVAQAIRLAHERNGEIRLRLHPPELGALRLQMRVQEGTLTARLEVETPAAREVLLENLPNLRDRLAEHNIRVNNFDVTLMNDGFGGQPSGREDFSGPRHSPWSRGAPSEPQPSRDNTEEHRGSVIRRVTKGRFDVVI